MTSHRSTAHRHQLRRRQAYTTTATAVFAVFLLAAGVCAPAAAQSAGHGTKPVHPVTATDMTSTTPPAPTDAAGTPTAHTVIRSDSLGITKVDSDTTTTAQGYWGNGTAAPTYTAQSWGRNLLNSQYPARAGRFIDPYTDRTASLRMVKAGSDGLFTVGSANSVNEAKWGPVSGASSSTVTDGATYILGDDNRAFAVGEATGSPALGSQVADDPLSNGATPNLSQQWSFVPATSTPGAYRIADRGDGLCLGVGSAGAGNAAAVGADVCGDSSGADVAWQLWKPRPDGGGTFLIQNVATDKLLTHGTTAAPGITQTTWASSGDTPVQQWRITQLLEGTSQGVSMSPMPTWSAADKGGDASLGYGMAAGDLDQAVGDAAGTTGQSQYHDEIAVAYVDNTQHLVVRVIDYNATTGHLLVTRAPGSQPVGQNINGAYYAGSVNVAIGDFNGDAHNEIAVTWQESDGFHVGFLTYRANGAGRSLTFAEQDVNLPLQKSDPDPISPVGGWADTTAGDFVGNGTDQLGLAYVAKGSDGVWHPQIAAISFDGQLGVSGVGVDAAFVSDGSTLIPPTPGPTWTRLGIRITNGLFTYDPKNGFDQRQLGVAWWQQNQSNSGSEAWTQVKQVASRDSSPGCALCTLDLTGSKSLNVALSAAAAPFLHPLSVSAGGFFGTGNANAVQPWGMAVAATGTLAANIALLQTSDGKTLTIAAQQREALSVDTGYVLSAYDRTGQSLILGAPVVFTATSIQRPTVVAAQPPAHTDWLGGAFVNVSRHPDYNVTMSQSNTQSYTSSYTTHASSTIGVSETLEASVTTKAGVFGVVNAQASLSVGQNLNRKWESDQSSLDKYSTTIKQVVSSATDDDDIVNGYIAETTIFRYPILGPALTKPDGTPYASTQAGCTSTCHGYYEVSVPGTITLVNGDGRDYDWYQPSWQNGNVLSYPSESYAQNPPDLGSYSYYTSADHSNKAPTTTVNTPAFAVTNTVGGILQTANLDIDQAHGQGHDTTAGGSWSVGADVKVSGSVQFKYGVGSTKVAGSLSGGFDKGSTWSQTNSGESETAASNGFELTTPPVPQDRSYQVATSYYYDTNGVQRVIHGVDLQASDASRRWWQQYYKAPDPALNMPDNIVLGEDKDNVNVLDIPQWNPLDMRQHIRGFAALQPVDDSSPLTSNQPYSNNPVTGDPVHFAVEVHNYSLSEADQVPVNFYVVPVDDNGSPQPGVKPVLLGSTSVPKIAPQGMQLVNSPTWTAGQPGDYRIFVQLDPANSLGEVHPLRDSNGACPADQIQQINPADPKPLIDPMTGQAETLACGQNNQGWGEVTVSPKSSTVLRSAGPANAANGANAARTAALSLNGGGLKAPSFTNGRLGAPRATTTVISGHVVAGDVLVDSNVDSGMPRTLLVYDGRPGNGNLIASTTVHGATASAGGSAHFTWQARRVGKHTLYEVLLGNAASGQRSQVQKLHVTVVRPAATPHSSRRPQAAAVQAGSRSGSLAMTGVDVVGWTVFGVSLLAAGTVMTLLTARRRRAVAALHRASDD